MFLMFNVFFIFALSSGRKKKNYVRKENVLDDKTNKKLNLNYQHQSLWGWWDFFT